MLHGVIEIVNAHIQAIPQQNFHCGVVPVRGKTEQYKNNCKDCHFNCLKSSIHHRSKITFEKKVYFEVD